ncbi:UNKNOWN [Stylonychia lemnae]|uniref:Uncharacterized protein n=1 Tax=Stylonychia lemnae TaxID=5949 RepID=A0A078AZ55_STYLE|nr:UNKNOWN [Stylonychia lemnae]|eukprot:CDW86098.1 UNKNOWN [Stylonychia lemnae]
MTNACITDANSIKHFLNILQARYGKLKCLNEGIRQSTDDRISLIQRVKTIILRFLDDKISYRIGIKSFKQRRIRQEKFDYTSLLLMDESVILSDLEFKIEEQSKFKQHFYSFNNIAVIDKSEALIVEVRFKVTTPVGNTAYINEFKELPVLFHCNEPSLTEQDEYISEHYTIIVSMTTLVIRRSMKAGKLLSWVLIEQNVNRQMQLRDLSGDKIMTPEKKFPVIISICVTLEEELDSSQSYSGQASNHYLHEQALYQKRCTDSLGNEPLRQNQMLQIGLKLLQKSKYINSLITSLSTSYSFNSILLPSKESFLPYFLPLNINLFWHFMISQLGVNKMA